MFKVILLFVVVFVVGDYFITRVSRKGIVRMIDEFVERFPDRCPVCAFQRAGVSIGATTELTPAPHDCPERAGCQGGDRE